MRFETKGENEYRHVNKRVKMHGENSRHHIRDAYSNQSQGEEPFKRSAFILIPFVLYTVYMYVCYNLQNE